MSDLTVTRWRKYGKDRLYVLAADGSKLGSYDLATAVFTPQSPAVADALSSAVQQWLEHNGLPQPRATAVLPLLLPPPPSPPSPSPPSPSWVLPPVSIPAPRPVNATSRDDLATRRAGEQARHQAVALRQARPVRTVVARVLGVHTDERAWRIGADGEAMLAEQLARLIKADDRWHVLHAIPVGSKGSDIDHVVVGPAGVFTLNAKHHPDARIWVNRDYVGVNGRRTPYVRNSRHEALRAGRWLSAAYGRPVAVRGVVVPVGNESLVVKEQPTDVSVVSRSALVTWLRQQPEVLSGPTVTAIFDLARRPETWR